MEDKIKVKILIEYDYKELQNDINNYIEYMNRKDIIDIKYQTTHNTFSAMIIYNDNWED